MTRLSAIDSRFFNASTPFLTLTVIRAPLGDDDWSETNNKARSATFGVRTTAIYEPPQSEVGETRHIPPRFLPRL